MAALTAAQLMTRVSQKRDTVKALKNALSRTRGQLQIEAGALAKLEDECRQRGIQLIVVPAAEPREA